MHIALGSDEAFSVKRIRRGVGVRPGIFVNATGRQGKHGESCQESPAKACQHQRDYRIHLDSHDAISQKNPPLLDAGVVYCSLPGSWRSSFTIGGDFRASSAETPVGSIDR